MKNPSGESESAPVLYSQNETTGARIRIGEIPPDERPRERLSRGGGGVLSDAELIAIFIRTGTKQKNAVEVARELLEKHGSLQGLSRCSVKELQNSAKGIGLAKACELAAVFEISKRLAKGSAPRPKIDTPEAVYHLLATDLQSLRQEVVRVLLLNTKYELIAMEEVSSGSVNESVAHPREIFRPALVHSAYAVAVVHNHPSGDPTPSEADRRLTRRLAQAADSLGVALLDHVIIGSPSGGRQPYVSFREMGLL